MTSPPLTQRLRARPLPSFRRLALIDPVTGWWARQGRLMKGAVSLGLLAAALLYPLTLSTRWQSVLFFPVGLYILLALGLNVVVGQAGLLDLGYVAFYAVGAYTAAVLTTTSHWNIWAALPAAIVLAMLAGVVLGAPTLRLRGDYLAIVTLGFGEIVRIIAQNNNALGQSRGITGIPHPSSIFGVEFKFDPLPYYYLVLVAIVLAVVMVVRLRRSRVGRAWAAVREDEDAAEVMGVPTFRMKLLAFAVGASTGGLGGWIYASKVSFINPDNFPFFFSVIILAAVVLGGMGSLPGVIVGGFAIAFLPEYLRSATAGATITHWLNRLVGGQATDITEYRVLLFGLALVVVMVFRPQGLLPSRQRAAELAEAGSGEGLAATLPPEEEHEEGFLEPTGNPQQDQTGAELGQALETPPTGPADRATGTQPDADTGAPVGRRHRSDGGPSTENPMGSGDGPGTPARCVLELRSVDMDFGGVRAMKAVSLAVDQGEIFGVIGPNGAGKTTLFNCVTGVFRPTGGDIVLDGESIVGRKAHRITRAGVARTFQNIRLFPNMTALDNVLVGTDAKHRTGALGALLGLPYHRREESEGRAEAMRLLAFVDVAERAGDIASNLPYGHQRRLEIARAMATQARILLLDEPAAGMNPSEKQSLIRLIRRIRDQGLTVLLIEHDMGLVMNVCDRLAVLDFGEKIAEGLPGEIQQNQRVIEAYLGAPADAS